MSRLFPRLYDLVMGAAERGRLARWRHSIVRPATGCLLEVGAGTGLNFPYYRAGARVLATDPDIGMLERARERAAHSAAAITLVAADAQALPFRDASFDGAVIGLAMCTVPEPQRALAETRRVLRFGAPLRMLEHVRVARPVIGSLQQWLTPLWRRVAGGCHLDRDTVRMVAESGFIVEAVRPHAGGVVVEIAARAPRPPRRSRQAPQRRSMVRSG